MPALSVYPTVRLVDNELELAYAPAGINRRAPLPADAEALFVRWSQEYGDMARRRAAPHRAFLSSDEDGATAPRRDGPQRLLLLGEEMLASLPDIAAFLQDLLEAGDAPLIVEFAIGKTDESGLASAFLDAPWELLATKGAHLAMKDMVRFCPIRRIGRALEPESPSEYRLNIVFMAAAPRGYDNLDFENEEVALLEATQHMKLDFTCEESGMLPLLAQRVSEEQPDVVHLTCHGTLHPRPFLLMEDEFGDREDVTPQDILQKLPTPLPRLIFSSACETAQADTLLTPLTRHLLRAGAPAVLGWAAPVLDNEATLFAAALYERLAAGEELCRAMAAARYALLTSDKLPQRSNAATASSDWHMARLTLAPKGGGRLANPAGASRRKYQGTASREFLDERGEVAIASAQEFVGRRRHIQDILREFRAARPPHAGVLVRGFGGQGKSSLAGRIAHRLEDTHRPIVVFGKKEELPRYGAEAILTRFLDAYSGVNEIQNFHSRREEVRNDPSRLETVLRQLLEGVCRQRIGDRLPVLLIIDDFEKILEEHSGSDHTVRADYKQAIRAVIRAFAASSTDSRLLITSRYLFTLPDGNGDLTGKLRDLPLPPMQESESRKQFFAKLHVAQKERRSRPPQIEQRQFREILNLAEGVPRLQDILFTLALEDADKCNACLSQMRDYLAKGAAPDEQKLRELFADLTIETLLNLLTLPQKELLRASTLFETPFPETVMRRLAEQILPNDAQAQKEACHRLKALALWDSYEDLYDYRSRACGVHPLVRPRAGTLNEAEKRPLAETLVPLLYKDWGGKEGQRALLLDSEIARLALAAEQAEPLAQTAEGRLRYLAERFEYRQAAQEAVAIARVLDAEGQALSLKLLRLASERCQQVGEVEPAARFRERALTTAQEARLRNEAIDETSYAALLVVHARALVEQGQPETALEHLKETAQTYEQLGDTRSRAVTLGDIARIMTGKGQVDDALALHRERIAVYEQLGDRRERAITLGDIARIMTGKGQVDDALALHREKLAICEQLGDTRSRAVTLGDIARIMRDKGQVDDALALHQEEMRTYEQLGDRRSRAVTLGDIARIMRDKGQVDDALALHQERIAVYEQLGDRRERAITLGDIARIMRDKGQVDDALALHREKLAICEQLGDTRSRAVTLGDIARIMRGKGQVGDALALHREQIAICEQLGDADCIANTLWSIATIQLEQQQFQEAAQNLQQSYAILTQIGRLDGICMVGLSWGQILVMDGHRDEGLVVLTRSRDGFVQLGQQAMAQQAQAIIEQM